MNPLSGKSSPSELIPQEEGPKFWRPNLTLLKEKWRWIKKTENKCRHPNFLNAHFQLRRMKKMRTYITLSKESTSHALIPSRLKMTDPVSNLEEKICANNQAPILPSEKKIIYFRIKRMKSKLGAPRKLLDS